MLPLAALPARVPEGRRAGEDGPAKVVPRKGCRTMNARKRQEDYYAESFPEDFGERLERLIELAGLSWEEFAERLRIDVDRVMEWREGAVPTGEGFP